MSNVGMICNHKDCYLSNNILDLFCNDIKLDLDANTIYADSIGSIINYDSLCAMAAMSDNCVDLIVTSPPFPLIIKKTYGNRDEDKYLDWFMPFVVEMKRIIKPSGSIVIEMGS